MVTTSDKKNLNESKISDHFQLLAILLLRIVYEEDRDELIN